MQLQYWNLLIIVPTVVFSFQCSIPAHVPDTYCNGSVFNGATGVNAYYYLKLPKAASTAVCCQAKGFSDSFGEMWKDIGCFTSIQTVAVPWGLKKEQKAILCFDERGQTDTVLDWY